MTRMYRQRFAIAAVVTVLLLLWWGLRPSTPQQDGYNIQELEEAWRRASDSPADPTAWLSLGEVQAYQDREKNAEQSYRRATKLGDAEGSARVRLGFLLYASGRDEEALALLLQASTEGAQAPLLDFTIRRLAKEVAAKGRPGARPNDFREDDSGSLVGQTDRQGLGASSADEDGQEGVAPGAKESGKCVLSLRGRKRARGTYIVPLLIGEIEAELILDTGASLTVITQDLADRLNLSPLQGESVSVVTVNGRTRLDMVALPDIDLGDRSVEGARAAVCGNCVEDIADGLFGLDLQTALQVQIDLVKGELRFLDCDN